MAGKKVDLKELSNLFGSKKDDKTESSSCVDSKVSNPSERNRRKSALERSEEHRQEGNRLYALQCFEDAADMYTRACNASPMDYRGYSNRCAAYTSMGKYKEALADAEQAVSLEGSVAKVWGRKALAHASLKQHQEAFEAYKKALSIDPGNEGYLQGMSKSREMMAKTNTSAHSKGRQEDLSRSNQHLSPEQGMNPKNSMFREKKTRIPMQAKNTYSYERELAEVKASRRNSIAKWKFSIGRDAQEEGPIINKDSSPNVDVFCVLRGKCTACSSCTMWWREHQSGNGWNDLSMFQCQTCGCANEMHENCGVYTFHDPQKLQLHGEQSSLGDQRIQGIHSFK